MEPARPSVVEEAEAAAIKLKAEAEAAAIKLKADAEAAAIKLKAEAEAVAVAAAIKLKAEAEAAAAAPRTVTLTFEQLLVDSGYPAAHIEASALLRARVKYGHLVTLALMERNPAVAREAYELGKRLPSTTTVATLKVAGYKLNGLLFEGSELVICFKDESVYLLKSLRDDEARRARAFHEACSSSAGGAGSSLPPIPHITPYELLDSDDGKKHFMIMPKFSTALEPLTYLSVGGVTMVWEHMRQALEGLHAVGFAHADVKPANICLSEGGLSAVLIDLGSVARLGEPTSSTTAYVPRDMGRGRARTSLDWWMLAMTLAEKGCGPDHGLAIGGNVVASRAELRTHLAAHLAPDVWAALEPKLD
jgi:hypothetical protein